MPLSPDEVRLLADSLEGGEIARIVNIACLALIVYEWLITLDQEIEYFWAGKWTLSRSLFFFNRYIPPFLVLFGLIELFGCQSFRLILTFLSTAPVAIRFSLISAILALGIIQAMLILRVWYLFSNQQLIQYGVVVIWLVSIVVSLAYTGVAAKDLKLFKSGPFLNIDPPGCRASRPDNFWRMFMPSLFLHAILYILTAYRALRNRRILKEAPVLKRLLRDGGFFFFVVFVSVGFTVVGALLKDIPQLNIPIIFSNYLITVTSIAMSRIMFSIHSLASHLGSETGWLLSNVELRRVDWRKGATEGEIIIERFVRDEEEYIDMDISSTASFDGSTLRSQSVLKMSRVGMLNDDTFWSQ